MVRGTNHVIADVRDVHLRPIAGGYRRVQGGAIEPRAVDRWMALLSLLVIVAIWPLCATVWLIQWTFVRFMTRAPRGTPTPRL